MLHLQGQTPTCPSGGNPCLFVIISRCASSFLIHHSHANTHCSLFGSGHDAKEVKLEHSKTHSNKFEKGHTDEFEVRRADVCVCCSTAL